MTPPIVSASTGQASGWVRQKPWVSVHESSSWNAVTDEAAAPLSIASLETGLREGAPCSPEHATSRTRPGPTSQLSLFLTEFSTGFAVRERTDPSRVVAGKAPVFRSDCGCGSGPGPLP